MALTESQIEAVDALIDTARDKGYRDETIEILIMLACTKQMHENYGGSEKAIRKITEYCKECKSCEECLSKTLLLTGFDESKYSD